MGVVTSPNNPCLLTAVPFCGPFCTLYLVWHVVECQHVASEIMLYKIETSMLDALPLILSLSLNQITCFGGSLLPCWEDAQAVYEEANMASSANKQGGTEGAMGGAMVEGGPPATV